MEQNYVLLIKKLLERIKLALYILSNAKSVNGGNNSIFGFSTYNIHVIQNQKKAQCEIMN